MVQSLLLGQVPLIITVSRSHSDTPLSVGLFWTSDQPDAQTPLPHKKQHSEEMDIHAPRRIRTRIPNKPATADPHLRPRGHFDRPGSPISTLKSYRIEVP
jgi:hypothetical protein